MKEGVGKIQSHSGVLFFQSSSLRVDGMVEIA